MKKAINDNTRHSTAQNLFTSPPPIGLFKSLSSQFSKKSFFRFSAVLAPLLLAPFSSVQAVNFGVAGCSTTSSTACIGGTYTDGLGSGFTVSVGDTLDTTPDEKTLKITGALNNPANYFTLTANNSILTTSNFTVANGSKATFDFKNSAYKGNFTIANNGGFDGTSSFTFDGNYQGTSDDSVKGYAYVGKITAANQAFVGTFKNDANMKGDIIFNEPKSYKSENTINFTNSSLEGNIIKKYTVGYTSSSAATINFSGNSSKGFALKGDINNTLQILNVTFSNQAKMIGDIRSASDPYGNPSPLNLDFNNASLEGGIDLRANGGTFKLTASASSKLNVSSFVGTNGGFTDTVNMTLNSSILQGRSDGSSLSYTNTNDNFTLTATNGSKVYMNLTANQVPGFPSIKPSNTISLTDSTWIGNITINNGKASLTLKNSTMSGNIGGNQAFSGNFTDSSIGSIDNNNASSTLTFASVAPAAGSDPKPTDHTIGNITFYGKITGSIANTTIGNLSLKSGRNIANDLSLKNSFLNYLLLDNGANLKFSATNSIIGKAGNTGTAIKNNWGGLDGTLNSTTVNGNITWGDANFNNSTAKDKGLNFINKSTLNGNITAPTTGNFPTANIFSFDNSTMNGNIVVNKKANGSENTVTVNFTGGSTFAGDITGNSIFNGVFNASTIKSNNIVNDDTSSTLNFTGVIDSSIANINFAGVINGDLSHSDIGTLVNNNTASSLSLSNKITDTSLNPDADASAPINTLGDITFAGKLDVAYHKSVAKSFNVSGTTNLSYSDGSKVGSLNVAGGTSTLNLANQSTLGALNVNNGTSTLNLTNQSALGSLNVTGGNSTVNLKSGSLILSTIGISAENATSSVYFSSETTGDNAIDFTKSNEMLKQKLQALAQAKPEVENKPQEELKPEADAKPEVANKPDADEKADAKPEAQGSPAPAPTIAGATVDGSVPTAPIKDEALGAIGGSSDSFTKEQLALLSKNLAPQDILSYLSMANISAYAGNINTQAGTNDVDLKDGLYLGGNVNTTGGTANITMSFSEAFIKKLQDNPLTNAFLYAGDGPTFVVTTNGENATNNIALSGSVKGVAEFNYLKGNTNIIFADTIASADATTNTATSTAKEATINGNTYQNGIYVSLDATKADTILGNYRDLFPTNTTTFKIDKVSNPDIYTATISGAMVGEVSSLPHAGTPDMSKSYEAIFAKDAVFIGKINIADRGVSMNLSQGSKLILEDGSNIAVLSSAGDMKPFVLNHKDITGDSIYQDNTIIDLATGGNPSSSSQIKNSYSVLNIGEVKNLNNALFRVSYNPFSSASDDAKNKSDHIIINSSSSGSQTDYLQAYQNSTSPVLGNLSDKNILVLSVKNDFASANGNKTAGLTFNTKSSVLQGYDLIETTFDKRIENSSTGNNVATPTAPTPPATDSSASGTASGTDSGTGGTAVAGALASAGNGVDAGSGATGTSGSGVAGADTWTNYYIASAQAQITQSSKNLTQAAASSNYSIFLANINDLNKRLGELRDNTNAQGVWARVFNGMSTSNRGEEVKTYSTNVQVGYDISLPNSSLDGKTYLGFALSYGYNKLGSESFDGKANLIEVGAYYSYVGNTGFYNDMILKYAYISNDLSMQNNENPNTTFNSSTVSLGEELGYRFYFNLKETKTSKHSLYLEPNAEFILGYVGNGGFDQVNGNAFLNAAIDSILAFRGRAGGVLGYSLKTAHNQTDFRLGLSYVGDIVGGGNMNFKTNFSDAQLDLQSNQMALVSVGVNSILSDQWKVYADVDTSFGGKYYNQNYLVSVGGRYAFGKKTRFIENPQSRVSTKDVATTSIKEGYYFDVYTLAKNAKLSKDQITLLSKYPYVISLEKVKFIDPKTKAEKIAEVQKILIGPFKTKEGAQQSEKVADEIAKILNKKETNAILKEVK